MMEIQGLKETLTKFQNSRASLKAVLDESMDAALDVVQDSIEPYPPERPNQKYIRTEDLGKSLGSGFGGGKQGNPDIREVKQGSGFIEGVLGSRLSYAPYVIGQNTQAWMHRGRWWTNSTLISKAYVAVQEVFTKAVNKWSEWMDK